MKSISQENQIVSYRVGRSRSGLGLFAAAPFKKGDFVIEYSGEMISTEEADERDNKYLFEINSRWTVDGSSRKNIARYINHSCRPNCEVDIKKKKIMVYALKRIKPGEELAYDYDKEYFDEFIKPFGCRCEHCRRKK